MRLTYYGHSAFLIETKGVSLLFDPFITGNKLAEKHVSADDLSADVILLTHAHSDHWGDTVSIARRSDALVVGNFEITRYLAEKHGYENIRDLNTGGKWRFDWGEVIQTYARHSSSFPDGAYGGNPNGYLLHLEGKWIYNTGDTCPFTEMSWIGEDYPIEMALMPVGDCFTMGPAESLRAIKMIRPRRTVPLHYNTFPPIEIDIRQWAVMVREAGYEPNVLEPGETIEL